MYIFLLSSPSSSSFPPKSGLWYVSSRVGFRGISFRGSAILRMFLFSLYILGTVLYIPCFFKAYGTYVRTYVLYHT